MRAQSHPPPASEPAAVDSATTARRHSYASVVKTARGSSPPPPASHVANTLGKFGSACGLKEYPSGKINDFQQGLLDRIGMPHLEFFKAMESEHCVGTGCATAFTTRNYGITSCSKHEWDVVVNGAKPPPEHLLHDRKVPDVDDKLRSETAKKAGLRREEVIAVVLYTGPMYVIYNAILTRFPDCLYDSGQCIWDCLSGKAGQAKNLYSTTLNVLVSAVQKLSSVTVYIENLHLYRGTGGDVNLSDHFFNVDDDGCKGMTDWGFFSATRSLSVAQSYSGLPKGRPNPILFEIQTNCVDRGASVEAFSQYPSEGEYIFVPCSFVEQVARARIQPDCRINCCCNLSSLILILPARPLAHQEGHS